MINLTNHRREIALPGLWHDFANLFPMLDAAGQDALRADIQAHGVHDSIILFNGRILDGRNRYMAARDLGQDFPVADFDGTDAEALAYVLSTNLHRRHLNESQRAAVAAKLANMRQGERTDLTLSANLQKVSQSAAAELLNVSERSVATAKKVIEQGAPELVAAVESGSVSVSAAGAVAELPQEEQVATVSEGPKAVQSAAKAVRKKKSAQADQDEDPETAKVMRELASMTPVGIASMVVELRTALAEEKASAKAGRAEIQRLKDQIKLFDGDKDQVIKGLNKTIEHKHSEMFRAKASVQAELRKNFALEKRIKELETMGVVRL